MGEQEVAVGGQQPQIRLQTHHQRHPSNVSQCRGASGVPVQHLGQVAVPIKRILLQRLIHSSWVILNVLFVFTLEDLSAKGRKC